MKAFHLIQSVADAEKALRAKASTEKRIVAERFFKTGPGQYSEHDRFLGVTIPEIRTLLKQMAPNLPDIDQLVQSDLHEVRLLGLLYWVQAFEKGDSKLQDKIYANYCENLSFVNNWDLVDLTAPKIPGAYLWKRAKKPLYAWVKSRILWERRIALLSTFYFIRQGQFADTLRLSEVLLEDPHDLMHKAVGWMLREVGKRDLGILKGFLRKNYSRLPQTSLRYAIERLPESQRKKWLKAPQ